MHALLRKKTITIRLSNSGKAKRSAEQARGEHHYGPDQSKRSGDGVAHQAKGQQQQPHEWIEDQRQQGYGPAQYEK